jgi:cytoskeletal protein RodZ
MTTVGEILSLAREKKHLTLEQVEKTTKIRSKFIAAIEHNEFDKLPPGTFTKGFIKNYASFLGLPIEETLAFYRRQANDEKGPLVSKSAPPTEKKLFTPISLTSIGVAILLLVFFTYLGFSYLRFAGSPTLMVASPAKNAVVAAEQVEVLGKTDPDATVTINDQTVPVNESGSFTAQITLTPGLNTLTITAVNKFHRQTTITRNLRLEK